MQQLIIDYWAFPNELFINNNNKTINYEYYLL